MKLAFIGGVKYSLDLLSHLIKNDILVSQVFSYDESKKSLYSDYASFDEITKQYGIPHEKVANINDAKNIKILQELKPDIILVMGWSQILKEDILKTPQIATIGSHPTELPKYRGRAPIPWSIIKGLNESALTFFYMDVGIDDGDILDQKKFSINENDDASSLYEKMTEAGKQMLLENLPKLVDGTAKRTKQDESKFIEYWEKRTPEDGEIDWSQNNEKIHTLIRATTKPYPGAFSFWQKSKLVIWKSNYSNDMKSSPGKIIKVNTNGVWVGTGNGSVIIQEVNFKGKDLPSNKLFSSVDEGKFLKG